MIDPEKRDELKRIERQVRALFYAFIGLIFCTALLLYLQFQNPEMFSSPSKKMVENAVEEESAIEKGIDQNMGLKAGKHLPLVISNCTGCHSAAMITQNRATREGWREMIEWMQETQNLWELGENEELILDYLATNYAPEKKGRRAPLKDIEWYELE